MGCRAFALRGLSGWLLVAPRVFRAPSGPAAVCAGGRRPAREPSALRASLGASPRSPARPRHRPPAPRQIPPAPFTPAALVVLVCPARPCRRPPAPRQIPPAPSTPVGRGVLMCGLVCRLVVQPGPATAQVSRPDLTCRIAETVPNFARNSPATISNIEFRSLELQRFGALLNVHPIELRAKLRCGVSLLWLSLLLRGIALLG